MRILIATWNRNLVGGTEKYLQALLPGLLDAGHEIGLVYEHPFRPEQEAVDAPNFGLTTWCLADLGLAAVMRSIAEWKPDIVYSQGLDGGDLENALLDFYPVVLFAHNYYGTCGTGTKCYSFPQARACERRIGPACLLLHYPRRCGDLNPWTTWRTFRRQMQRHSRLADYQAVVVASSHIYREYVSTGLSVERVHLAPLPLPDSAPQPCAPNARPPQGRILLIGRLTPIKGGHYLIPAVSAASAKLNQPLTLTIAGDGGELERLRKLASSFQVPTEFVGWVDTSHKLELLRQTDLLAVPSLWPEPFGLVGIEAGSFGVPAVGYAVGGIPDWLISGRTGELAPSHPPSVEGLANAIVRVFADPRHYAELRRGAWELSQRFTLENHLSKLEMILRAGASANALRSTSLEIPLTL